MPVDSVEGLRAQIDRVDRQIVDLINERAGYASEIGRLKHAAGEQAYVPCREDEVLARAVGHSAGPVAQECVRAVFRELISGCRALERLLRVAYLGPAHTFSHLAALYRFGATVELIPVGTIAAVFEEVQRGHADFGIVPLENSTDGRIADTLEMFARMPLRISGEVQMRIHHSLLGRGPRADVVEVYSKPQALSQCRNWLAKNLPGARLVEVTSTATAAQLALEKPSAAAIASRQAGRHFGLEVLAERIEDNSQNVTRFAVIGQTTNRRTGKDKTALMFELPHRPGSLADAMAIFKRNRLNLTWIESYPVRQSPGEYLFFVELEGHESDLKVRRALESLRRKATRLEVLGAYPQSEIVD